MARNVTRREEPYTRLERILAAMTAAMEQHPEYREDDKAIVMLDSTSEKRGGLVTVGYKPGEDHEAAAMLLQQTEALFKANGMTMRFVPVDAQNAGLQ